MCVVELRRVDKWARHVTVLIWSTDMKCDMTVMLECHSYLENWWSGFSSSYSSKSFWKLFETDQLMRLESSDFSNSLLPVISRVERGVRNESELNQMSFLSPASNYLYITVSLMNQSRVKSSQCSRFCCFESFSGSRIASLSNRQFLCVFPEWITGRKLAVSISWESVIYWPRSCYERITWPTSEVFVKYGDSEITTRRTSIFTYRGNLSRD